MLDPYVQRWAADPDGGGRFAHQRDLILNHPDQSCASLRQAWLPRKNGVTCPSDLSTCDKCGLEIFNEGALIVFEDCEHSWHWLCHCCEKTTTHPDICIEDEEEEVQP